jgi:hypothetical protein
MGYAKIYIKKRRTKKKKKWASARRRIRGIKIPT